MASEEPWDALKQFNKFQKAQAQAYASANNGYVRFKKHWVYGTVGVYAVFPKAAPNSSSGQPAPSPAPPVPGGSGGQAAPAAAQGAGLTNAGGMSLGGGADIPRAATSHQGLGVDVRSEFLGVSTYAPDTQVGPQYAAYAENVDGTYARGALSKRAGLIPLYPDRETEFDDGEEPPVVTLPAITAGHRGRSINALPDSFRNAGRRSLVLGYDDSASLGDGTSAAGTTELRAVAVDAKYNSPHDISRVKPLLSEGTSIAGTIKINIIMPERFRLDNADPEGRQASVEKLVVVASKNGFCLDRDAEDPLEDAVVLVDNVTWNGNTVLVSHAGLTAGDVWYYTVWGANRFELSAPAFWTEEAL